VFATALARMHSGLAIATDAGQTLKPTNDLEIANTAPALLLHSLATEHSRYSIHGFTQGKVMRALLAAGMLLAVPFSSAATQVMSLGASCCKSLQPRVLAGTITTEDRTQPAPQHWVRAIILWRGDRPIQDGHSIGALPEARALDDAARRAGHFRVGAFYTNRVHGAEVSRDGDTTWVLEQRFSVPSRDSGLVVLVDHVDSTPTIAGIAYIATALPAEYWGKFWESGDTVFLIRPRNEMDHLSRALRTSPRVRQFLDGTR
jgi:hypothetical protein